MWVVQKTIIIADLTIFLYINRGRKVVPYLFKYDKKTISLRVSLMAGIVEGLYGSRGENLKEGNIVNESGSFFIILKAVRQNF